MKIYLAGGWFTPEQEEEHSRIYDALTQRTDYNIFNPRIAGEIDASTNNEKMSKILIGNVEAIQSSDVVVVIYDGKDTGTIWEAGYAYALKKPIIYYAEKPTTKVNLMLAKTGDFVRDENTLVDVLNAKPVFKNVYNSYKGDIE